MSLPWSISKEEPEEERKFWILDYSFYMYNGSFAHRYKCKCRSAKTGEPRSNCAKCGGEGFQYMQSQTGHPTGGLYTIFGQIIQMAKAGYEVITVFDPPKDQLNRMKLLDTYKGGRPPVPEWITYQMDYGQEVLPYTSVECLYSDHDESDDVMATRAMELAEAGHKVVISSDDKDMLTCLKHPNISIYRMRNMFNVREFREKYDFPPGRFSDYLAICGDAADNFNLLSGLGPKAAEWIIQNTKESCMEIFDKLDQVPFKYQKKLINCCKPEPEEGKKPVKCPAKSCLECKYLTTTKRDDMRLSLNIANLEYKAEYRKINKEPSKDRVKIMLEALDLNSALKNINYLF